MGYLARISLPLVGMPPPLTDFYMYQLLDQWIGPYQANAYMFYLVLLWLGVFLGLYLLTKGGDWLSEHSANLASILGVPPVVIGLTIVSIATSMPELFTSVSALRSNSPGLVLGNIIGSNIANIGLILGVSLLLGAIQTDGAVSRSQRACLLILTLIFCGILFYHPRGELGTSAGILLILFICIYLVVVAKHALREKQGMENCNSEIEQGAASDSPNLLVSLAMLLVATFTLWVGSDSLVYGSKNLAYLAGLPEELIGFTLIALGTSLPELAASISLVRKQHTEMLLGNVVGSNLFNIALIGGIAGILGPVRCGTPRPWVDYLFLLGITFLLIHWLRGRDLGKKHGLLLLSLYLGACITTWLLNS